MNVHTETLLGEAIFTRNGGSRAWVRTAASLRGIDEAHVVVNMRLINPPQAGSRAHPGFSA